MISYVSNIFRFAKPTKNWKPLGSCVFKVNESKKDKRLRLLARVDANSLIFINTYVTKGAMKAEWSDEKVSKLLIQPKTSTITTYPSTSTIHIVQQKNMITITAVEYHEDAKEATPSLGQFLLRASTKEEATSLLTALTNALQ